MYPISLRSSYAQRLFFALDGKFLGVGTLELSNPPGWGRKKKANGPSSVNTATFCIDRTVEQYHFKHFNVRFFVSINVFLCNSAILIETRRDDTSYGFHITSSPPCWWTDAGLVHQHLIRLQNSRFFSQNQ